MTLDTSTLLIQVLGGLTRGTILFIVASGLSLIFGVMRIIDFAHGSLYMLGAFLAGLWGKQLADQGNSFLAMVIVAPIVIGLVGVGIETMLLRRIYKKEHLLQLLLTYGLTLILGDVVRMTMGSNQPRLVQPAFLKGGIPIMDRRFPTYDFFLLIVGLVIAVALWLLLSRTRWGRIIRAAVSNPEILSALGVNVQWVFTGVFALGCWLAGLGGVLQASRAQPALGMDSQIIIEAFAVVVIGGLGSFAGALVGSLIIGVVLSVGILVVPQGAEALTFAVMAGVLIWRPWGLLGKQEA
ncbi:MAG TPA: branched-chain amino acid ABC transporter permease [Aggregatilineales bacterium]|nr:branched-chain amino acid ABC transporter permease [Aggregatilineales bacterium]